MNVYKQVLATSAVLAACCEILFGQSIHLDLAHVFRWDQEQSMVYSVAFSPSGKDLAVSSGDGCLRLWNLTTKKPRLLVRRADDVSYCVAFSPNGKLVATGSHNKNLAVVET